MSMFGRKKSPRGSAGADDLAGAGTESSTPDPADGPHDRSAVGDVDAFYASAGLGYLDLGAMVIGIPQGTELNVTLAPTGMPEFHVVSPVARIVPHVFAAPRSAGQWRTWVTDLAESLEQQGAEARIVDGPFGREIRAELPGATFHAMGADGPRWMVEVRVLSTAEYVDAAAEQGREVLRHLVVDRGSEPMPVREHLPLAVPEEVQQALVQAQGQMAEQQRAQAYEEQMAAARSQGVPAGGHVGHAGPESAEQAEPQQPRRSGSAMDSLRDEL